MRISVFGMGYVGIVSGACLAELGHEVVGVDVNPLKVGMVNDGVSPIVEHGLEALLQKGVASGRLRATSDPAAAVRDTEVSMISVGTPSDRSGAPSLDALSKVLREIGAALRESRKPHTVVIRSTVPPGTNERLVAPSLAEAAARRIGDGLDVVSNPEFLREGTALRDFQQPPFTLVGSTSGRGHEVAKAIYEKVAAPVIATTPATAESVKYLCNVFHAAKISFANEAGAILKQLGVDSREVMRIFCEDRILNISPAYLRPGFAFGGSCLPKDLRALLALARVHDVEVPLLANIAVTNEVQVDRAFRLIEAGGRRPVAQFGLAFKPGTDDLRESPLVTLAEKLIGKGYPVKIFDRHVQAARLIGSNKEFIDREIPHFERLMADEPREALRDAEVIVVGHIGAEEMSAIKTHGAGRRIIDLQGNREIEAFAGANYEGLCW